MKNLLIKLYGVVYNLLYTLELKYFWSANEEDKCRYYDSLDIIDTLSTNSRRGVFTQSYSDEMGYWDSIKLWIWEVRRIDYDSVYLEFSKRKSLTEDFTSFKYHKEHKLHIFDFFPKRINNGSIASSNLQVSFYNPFTNKSLINKFFSVKISPKCFPTVLIHFIGIRIVFTKVHFYGYHSAFMIKNLFTNIKEETGEYAL